MATVELRSVTKIFSHSVKAVNNANITINDKEFVVLVGPSGCGKTTTLRMIAGLEDITAGEIYIDGNLINDIPPKDRDIAMVFQNYALYPHMSVYENMSFGLRIRKYPKEEIKSRVNEAAQILHIEELLDRKPKALSGGQRQRVAVGRAIVRKPKAFLFDEPLSNLDAKLRIQMRTEISSLHTRLQATMIYVTHDQTEAMTMGDKIVVLKDGLIQQIGNPLELYNCPTNKFVAAFIGSPPMNILTASILEQNGKIIVDEGDFQIILEGQKSDKLKPYVNKEVLFGIRPEDLVYSQTPVKNNNIQTTVEVVEPLGYEIHLYVTTQKHQLTVRVPPRFDFNTGDIANFIPDLQKLHFFEVETEKTIV